MARDDTFALTLTGAEEVAETRETLGVRCLEKLGDTGDELKGGSRVVGDNEATGRPCDDTGLFDGLTT